jgi:hypothetical protein
MVTFRKNLRSNSVQQKILSHRHFHSIIARLRVVIDFCFGGFSCVWYLTMASAGEDK